MPRLAVLTGGGDCPGLNAAIRAVVRRALFHGWDAVGVRAGWRGLLENDLLPLDREEVSGILARGGTILRSSGANPFAVEDGPARIAETMRRHGIDALVAIGGEGTLGCAAELHDLLGVPIVGIPKTIDNDLSGTDVTIGFDTAVHVCTSAIERLHTTAESHNRVMVVEVMGRYSGWLAITSGLAGGADLILIPEQPLTVEATCESIRRRHDGGKDFSIIVVAEGCELRYSSGERQHVTTGVDSLGHPRFGGIGGVLAAEVAARTGYETRVTTLGHVQRGGTPTARDRILATRLGLKAVDLAIAGSFGKMAAIRGDEMVAVPLVEAAVRRDVPPEQFEAARTFFA